MRASLLPLVLLASVLALTGCDSSIPTFPRVGDHDAGLECGEELGACAASEICLQGRCYARCSESTPCGPLEECSSAGACVPRTSPPVDAGPPDPCESVTCDAPTPFCRAGACVACLSAADCVGMDPNTVCDLGRGQCVPAAPGICAPCNATGNCAADTLGLTCVTRGPGEPTERVCLPACDEGTCAPGFTCLAETNVCVPLYNVSCTGYRAALAEPSCDLGAGPDDSFCAPVGATTETGLVAGSCFLRFEGDIPVCHVPCTSTADCPVAMECNDAGFCARTTAIF